MIPFSAWSIVPEGFEESAHNHFLQSLIRRALRKLRCTDGKEFFSLLPIVELEVVSESSGICSVFLLCFFSSGIERFFYEMVSKWYLSGKRVSPSFFVHSVFSFAQEPQGKLSFCEIRFPCVGDFDQRALFRDFLPIASEIKLGSVSPYQAHRILELRGLFSSEKNSLIQERIASLIQHFPENFDYDLFGQMQHFFLSSSEEFKQVREYPHLSRMVYVFYLFRKQLKRAMEKAPDKRHVCFKVNRVRLHGSLGVEKTLGVFVGINFLKKNEIFEEQHLVKAIQGHLPYAEIVEGSLFTYLHKEERVQILYLEVSKKGEEDFTPVEIQVLQREFPYALENQVEKLMPAIFMPRNEEEVMKNIIRLSQELKYRKDFPQVFISFEEQTDFELTFTIVLVRVLFENALSIQKMFLKSEVPYVFIEDRIKTVGSIRGKHPKEATVFRLKLPKAFYMRSDHSVDLLKARQSVVEAIESAIGEFRDYNGGMIAKQTETLEAFQQKLPQGKRGVEAERFFHSIYPVEMRSVVSPSLLKKLYEEWQAALLKKDQSLFDFSIQTEREGVVLMTSFSCEEIKSFLSGKIQTLKMSSSEWMFFVFQKELQYYQGYIFLRPSQEKVDFLLQLMQEVQDSFLVSI